MHLFRFTALPRFKIHIQYDGTGFHGWQVQKKERTIQGELERVLAKLNKSEKINVIGSGRTDSGVHALDQVAHFDWNTNMDSGEIVSAINGNLQQGIRVKECAIVPDDFHARFSAVRRTYLYQCRTDEFIMDRHAVWQTGSLDVDTLNNVSEIILGEHDFTSFSKYNPEVDNRVCMIYLSEWTQAGNIVNYRVAANRFLHHMVRYLVGTMIEVANGKMTITEFKDLLNNPREDVQVYRSPAQGLFLENIDYNGADTF
ncbi:MAG TPA: tRNA pseudouridine(38-40) synthase TruA [Candidatus Marinimicrobia bacterium]|nr:tRNA pseudouridine(38-40) synthase TruA [Candidatus Neomarinimicrobiota bacterium]